MIEGQEDVTWEDWQALARACEESGIETLFRSDHYLSVFGRSERGSLDAWATINALAAVTSKLRLGTLVSPATFRHPAELAKVVVTADHVSGGRVELGLGTGWNQAEHEAYGFPFPPMGERMRNMEDQLQVIAHHWSEEGPAQPKPVQRPRPNLILGGRGGPRSIRMAARYADEYNTVNKTPAECAAVREQLDAACAAEDRDPIPLSLMTGWLAGEDRAELLDRAGRLARWQASDADAESFLAGLPDSSIAGTIDENLEHLGELAAAGVERVMLQHLLHRDLDAVEQIGRRVAPALVDGSLTRE
jgi:alkanesulfonate monooxygenase SsuD/methylene tetrahydromethanopterin reductase-like flavin-dependent oxidoreductase (luciferase family)